MLTLLHSLISSIQAARNTLKNVCAFALLAFCILGVGWRALAPVAAQNGGSTEGTIDDVADSADGNCIEIMINGTNIAIDKNTLTNLVGRLEAGLAVRIVGNQDATGKFRNTVIAFLFTDTGTVCGMVTAFMAATGGAGGLISINGRPLRIAPNTTLVGQERITVGVNVCLTATFNTRLQIISPSSVTLSGVKCDTICLRPSTFFWQQLQLSGGLPSGAVIIGGMNFNNPISTRAIQGAFGSVLQPCFSPTAPIVPNPTEPPPFVPRGVCVDPPLGQLNREYVTAQLSLLLAGGSGSPVAVNALWSNLGCPGLLGDFDPVTLSNGVTLAPSSMLKDLFMQAQFAIRDARPRRARDLLILAAFFRALNTCRPPVVASENCQAVCAIEDSDGNLVTFTLNGTSISGVKGACEAFDEDATQLVTKTSGCTQR